MTGLPNNPARAGAVVLAIASILTLSACDPQRTANVQVTGSAYDPVVYLDRATGCQYLSTGNFHALAPRMDANGIQICAVTAKAQVRP